MRRGFFNTEHKIVVGTEPMGNGMHQAEYRVGKGKAGHHAAMQHGGAGFGIVTIPGGSRQIFYDQLYGLQCQQIRGSHDRRGNIGFYTAHLAHCLRLSLTSKPSAAKPLRKSLNAASINDSRKGLSDPTAVRVTSSSGVSPGIVASDLI